MARQPAFNPYNEYVTMLMKGAPNPGVVSGSVEQQSRQINAQQFNAKQYHSKLAGLKELIGGGAGGMGFGGSGMGMGGPGNQLDADYGAAQRRLQSFLDRPAPTASTANRFEAGLSGNEARLNRLLDDPNSVQQTAAYKFRVGQGQEALQRQMAAKGMLGSGNRLMELTKYGQDMASQEYDNQAKRLGDLVQMYSGNWIGDKNANTQRYATDVAAHSQRGNLLSNLLNTTSDARYKQGTLNTGWYNAQTARMREGGGGTMRVGGGMPPPAFDANPFDNPIAWNNQPSAYKSWTDEERARSL